MKRNHLQKSTTNLMMISMCCVAHSCGQLQYSETPNCKHSGLIDISVPKCTFDGENV